MSKTLDLVDSCTDCDHRFHEGDFVWYEISSNSPYCELCSDAWGRPNLFEMVEFQERSHD